MDFEDVDSAGFVPPDGAPVAVSLGLSTRPCCRVSAWTFSHSEQTLDWLSQRVLESPSPAAVVKRRAEFLAGRYAAGCALAELGRQGPVPKGSEGAPLWPEGVVGAITHSDRLAAAVVCANSRCQALGVDIEMRLAAERAEQLLSHVGEPAELDLASALFDGDRGAGFSLMFSAKESLYKCLFPLCRTFFGFLAARLVDATGSAARGTVRLQLLQSLGSHFQAGEHFEVGFRASTARVITFASLER